MFAFIDAEKRHALSIAPSNADIEDRHPDKPPGIGHHHDVVVILDRERGHHLAVPRRGLDIDDTLPAAVVMRYS